MIDLDRMIQSAAKSSKLYFGSKQTMNAAKNGKADVIIISSNCPARFQQDIKHYSHLSKIPLYPYRGSSRDLGMACGKPFSISALAVRNITDPHLLRMVKNGLGDEK